MTGATDLDFNNGDVFVISLSSTGVPDAGFGGGDGIVTRDVAGRWDVGNDVIANGNKILVGGGTKPSGGQFDSLLLQLNDNGTADAGAFGGDGLAVRPVQTSDDEIHRMILQSGKVVAVIEPDNGAITLARFNLDAAGSLDSTFSGDGKAQHALLPGRV